LLDRWLLSGLLGWRLLDRLLRGPYLLGLSEPGRLGLTRLRWLPCLWYLCRRRLLASPLVGGVCPLVWCHADSVGVAVRRFAPPTDKTPRRFRLLLYNPGAVPHI